MDLDAIWQVHLWGPMIHYVTCEYLTLGEEVFGSNLQPKHSVVSDLEKR